MSNTPASTSTTVDAQWLAERHAAGADLLVLDVRTPAEFESAHIEGSYNVPLDTLKEHRADIARHLDTDVVLVCRSGARAEQADVTLSAAGSDNLHVLRGGMGAWESSGQRVVRGAQRWELERQVRLVAGGIVLSSILTSTVVPGAKWVAGGIGAGLTFAALSNTCAMGMLLSKLPYNQVKGTDPAQLVAQLTGR
ncbi:rhodanese-like domain-containing protein [Serinicoccus marinus]|uniref:rhodanese-like domain-containing protein n=1 Tax=Serinicoccus marinus TaxID=247333 RepID=UPI002491FFEE|nr:rhodanese-like domain-containing protein [Serinicoccus marinus]